MIDRIPHGVSIRNDLKPGDIGYLLYLHGKIYADEQGWDHTFEAYVAGPLAEFAKTHSCREQIWIVEQNRQVMGSIAIVSADRYETHSEKSIAGVAQLRWFLLDPTLRGKGLGRILVSDAISFAKSAGYTKIILLTTGSLLAAARIYDAFGFRVTEEVTHDIWGATVTEQCYELNL